jgi:hypothetical protein
VEETDAQGFMRELNRRPCSLTGVHELDTATDAREKKNNEGRIFKKKLQRSPAPPKPRKSCSRTSKNRTRPKKESWASKQI